MDVCNNIYGFGQDICGQYYSNGKNSTLIEYKKIAQVKTDGVNDIFVNSSDNYSTLMYLYDGSINIYYNKAAYTENSVWDDISINHYDIKQLNFIRF